jgi:uncharacterized protein YjbI with pentapeptide repeats
MEKTIGLRLDISLIARKTKLLSMANLRGAKLREADLREADLSMADLRGTDLRGTDLSMANLRGAKLREADLSMADLRGTDLREADLDFSCWPIWCGSKGAKVDCKLVYQLLAHVAVLDCADSEFSEIKEKIMPYAKKSHRAYDLGLD